MDETKAGQEAGATPPAPPSGDDADKCPHGVSKRKWSFTASPYARHEPRLCAVFDADSCPDCLLDRVRKLRAAFRLFVENVKRDPTDIDAGRRGNVERALSMYYDDLRRWL